MLRTALRTRSALRSGALTGLAQIVIAFSAAGAGALLARKFGRNAETDGFLGAYGVYIMLIFAAQALRLIVVPDFTRAAAVGRLGGEARAYAVAFVAVALPLTVLVALLAGPLGDLLTGNLPQRSADVAARTLAILVPAACVQLLASLAASALAAVDSYGTAAAGFALGAIAGLVVFVALANTKGVVALAWGLAVNALIALCVPLVGLWRRGLLPGEGPARWSPLARLGHLCQGAAVPLALQGCYLLALRFAAKLGVGSVTSFSYAFLAAATLVGATAFSLGVISAAPLTRRGFNDQQAGEHVVHASWVSLSLVGAAAGVFAVVGGSILGVVLGNAYGGDVGKELGHLVAYLAPWMVGWVGFAVTFPLVFVAGRQRYLVPLSLFGFLLCIPLGLGLRALWGLDGIAIAIGISTLVVAFGLMAALSRRSFAIAVVGLARLSLAIGAAAALTFGGLAVALPAAAAAVLGLVAYTAVIVATRSLGLSAAWTYVRGLQ